MVNVCLYPLLDSRIPEQEPHLFLVIHAWYIAGVSSYSITIQRKEGREGEREEERKRERKRRRREGEEEVGKRREEGGEKEEQRRKEQGGGRGKGERKEGKEFYFTSFARIQLNFKLTMEALGPMVPPQQTKT